MTTMCDEVRFPDDWLDPRAGSTATDLDLAVLLVNSYDTLEDPPERLHDLGWLQGALRQVGHQDVGDALVPKDLPALRDLRSGLRTAFEVSDVDAAARVLNPMMREAGADPRPGHRPGVAERGPTGGRRRGARVAGAADPPSGSPGAADRGQRRGQPRRMSGRPVPMRLRGPDPSEDPQVLLRMVQRPCRIARLPTAARPVAVIVGQSANIVRKRKRAKVLRPRSRVPKEAPMHQSDPRPRALLLLRSARSFLVVLAVVAAGAVIGSPPASAGGTYDVTIAGPSQSPLTGVPFLITGTVTPAAAGAKVQLQHLYGGEFHTVAVVQLDRDSSYTFAQVFDTVGGRAFRVTKQAGGGVGKGISPTERVFVTGSSVQSAVVLKAGDALISSRGTYSLTLLATGDLVMTLNSTGRTIWSFGTAGHPGATAILERDGNFIVHDSTGKVVKTTGTGGRPPGIYSLTLREDSDLWIYSPDGHFVWSNNTTNPLLRKGESLHATQFLRSSDQQYQLVMERTGDLALYDVSDGSLKWDTGTSEPNSRVTMGPAGAMTVYGPLGKVLWSTHTIGYPGAYAELEKDGTLVLYQKGVAIWASEGLGGVLGDDYPAYLRKASRDSIIDPWRFYNRECTSFVAWRMNSANGVDFQNFMDGGRFGSAGNWDDNARRLGYQVDNVPARGRDRRVRRRGPCGLGGGGRRRCRDHRGLQLLSPG